MFKKYSFKIMLTIGGISLIMTSCKKYIDQAPITSTYGAEFWTSQKSVEQATLAMYGQLRTCLRKAPAYNLGEASYFVNGDLVSGMFQTASGDVFLPYGLKPTLNPPWNFSYVPYAADVLQNWSRFYQLIAQCNLILQNVPKMSPSLFTSEDVRNKYLAEALFVRAYTYFYITRIWGDPVYVTQSYDDVDYGNIPPIARTPEKMVLDSCINDLKKASNYVSFSGGDPSLTTRCNKGSVYALLAHIYAWKHDYPNAHLACEQVITNGGYSLEPIATYKNIWKPQTSSESIFELPMQYNPNDPNFANQNDWAEAQFDCFATFLKGSFVDNQKTSCWVSPKGGIIDQFMDTTADLRYKAAYTYTTATGDVAGFMVLKYTNFNYQKPETKSGKYIENDLVLFRLADIILLNAEALAYNNDLQGAADNLALTESRAGITDYMNPTTQYDMVDEVVIERARELAGEGQWYYDLIRTEPTQGWLEYVGYPSDRVNPVNKGYYWPLDMSTLFPQDKLLTQNPWWAVHK